MPDGHKRSVLEWGEELGVEKRYYNSEFLGGAKSEKNLEKLIKGKENLNDKNDAVHLQTTSIFTEY